MNYCVLDFDLFREGCVRDDKDGHIIWKEIVPILKAYDSLYPQGRLTKGQQRMILDEISHRLANGLFWTRYTTVSDGKPIVIVLGKEGDVSSLSVTMIKYFTGLIEKQRLPCNGIIIGDALGLLNNGVYISGDGIAPVRSEVYYCDSQKSIIETAHRIRNAEIVSLERWANVNIHRAKTGFSDHYKFKMLYQMRNPFPGAPQLFGLTSVDDFFSFINKDKVIVDVLKSEYYDVLVKINIPLVVKGVRTVGLENYTKMHLRVNKQFVMGCANGESLVTGYFNIITVIGTNLAGANATGCRLVICFGIMAEVVPDIISKTGCLPISLEVMYHKTCFDMYENRYKAIWIAAGKGTGKSKICGMLKEQHKNFIIIDSDTYGRLLYQIMTGKCPFNSKSDPIELATWTYNFINHEDFDKSPSYHEVRASEFCELTQITLESLLSNKIPYNLFRSFSQIIAEEASGYLKVQDYCNMLGFIPTIVQGMTSTRVRTLVIFGHNTQELFPSMTNAMWRMESCFDSVPIILSRDRTSSILSQLFLCVYYETMEPLIANSLPTYVIVRALLSLPRSDE